MDWRGNRSLQATLGAPDNYSLRRWASGSQVVLRADIVLHWCRPGLRLGRRPCERELGPKKIDRYIQEILSDLLVHDSMRSGDLVATLDAWLSSGCNSTAAAAALFMERQTLHKRLNKIFDLLGGDPRGTSRLAAIHLATRLALSNLGTRK